MILVDSNIPMYLIGADHPHKHDAQRILERLVSSRERLVTDAEVFQEILHRYVAIRRKEAIQPAFSVLQAIVDQVLPIDQDDLLKARDIVLESNDRSARDAIHLAVMQRYKIDRIISFDKGLDSHPGIVRIST